MDDNARGPAVTPAELERERLQTYIDWADVRAPVWYWPAYAMAIGLWFIGYGVDPMWGAFGAALLCAVAVMGIRVMASRGQVAMPRFRGMPRRLLRAYLPFAAAGVVFVGALLFVVIAESAPSVLIGVVTGVLMALGGAWTSRRYRIEAQRLAEDSGITR